MYVMFLEGRGSELLSTPPMCKSKLLMEDYWSQDRVGKQGSTERDASDHGRRGLWQLPPIMGNPPKDQPFGIYPDLPMLATHNATSDSKVTMKRSSFPPQHRNLKVDKIREERTWARAI